MNIEPPLLIMARLPDAFSLSHVQWPEAADARITVNDSKFADLDMVEILFDGMTFLLSRQTAAETQQHCARERFEHLFCAPLSPDHCAFRIGPGTHIASAGHIAEVNRRLLQLGQWVGESVSATHAAWLPASRLADFRFFADLTGQYLDGGPLPGLFQTTFSRDSNGALATRGLHYFCGQEVRLSAPPHFSEFELTQRMVRIIDDLAANGKIHTPSHSSGMVQSERLTYLPSDDGSHVEIIIDMDPGKAVSPRP